MNFYRFQFSAKIIHLFNYLGTSSVLVILSIATLNSLSDKCNLSILYGFIVGFFSLLGFGYLVLCYRMPCRFF